MLDFEAITNFWFGDLPEPQFPFKPINIGIGPQQGELELVSPIELEEQTSGEQDRNRESKETPGPEGED